MRILICGAAGFVGSALAAHLAEAGHDVLKGVRVARQPNEVAIDYAHDLAVADWLPRLTGIDVVINAVGIIVERPGQRFDDIHRRAPCALFEACHAAGVKRIVQISALGAANGQTAYFRSKREADDFLMRQPVAWQVVRPALLYGRDGTSARFFRALASLPVLVLPGQGEQRLQPLHIADLCDAVLRLIAPAAPARQCVDLVGGRVVTYRQMLETYRSAMDLSPAPALPIPAPLIRASARVLGHLPGSLLTPDTWSMLQAGNTGRVGPTQELLGRLPRSIDDFIAAREAPALRQAALAVWRPLLLRGALALVWLLTALVSLFVYPVADSLALLARVGLSGAPALVALYGAAALDFVFGLATLFAPSRRLWLFQIAVIATYSSIIAVALPEYLAHPFGPLTKNLPILAILLLLYSEEKKPWIPT